MASPCQTEDLRQKYVTRIKILIEEQDEHMSDLVKNIDRMKREIGETTIPINPLFSSEDNFWTELEVGSEDWEALNIEDQAWDRVNQELLFALLYVLADSPFWRINYDYSIPPFSMTRSITNLKYILHAMFAQVIVFEEHYNCLKKQLEEIRLFENGTK